MRTFLSLALLSVIGTNRALPIAAPREDPELNPVVTVSQRIGIRDSNRNWLLYYNLWKGFGKDQKTYIKGAMKTVEDVSCIRFVEACDGQSYFLTITKGSSRCSAPMDGTGSRATLYLPYSLISSCYTVNTLMNNLFSALESFRHSLTYRPPAFKYSNGRILPASAYRVANYSKDIFEDFGVEYNNGSIMNSPANYKANDGDETIVPLQKIPNVLMDQREALGKSDIIKLNKMFNCSMD